MTLPYICPRCKGQLISENQQLSCEACLLKFPVRDGVPYLVAYGNDWYLKLREVLLYRDFCRKVKSGAIERDRLEPHQHTSAVIFDNLTAYFEQACSRIDFSKSPTILDVGAGCGEVSQKLALAGAEVYAIDLNMYDLHHDVRWMTFNMSSDLSFSERLSGPRIENPAFQRAIADGDAIPFADSSFDYVVLRAVAHHLFDLSQFMKEAYRVLRPDGKLLLISEPLASVLDDPAEYQVGDLDYEEGMHETRPYFSRYHRALRAAGFHDIQVQCYFVGFGHRIGRLQQRMKWGFDLNRRLEKRLVTGRIARLLNFAAGCMNLYAAKGPARHGAQIPMSLSDVPEIPMAELLVALPDDPAGAADAVRDFLPVRNRTSHIDLACKAIDRMIVRGVRPAEMIGGRQGRYLLTAATFYLANTTGASQLTIDYHAELALNQSPPPRFYINGIESHTTLSYTGWAVLTLPLAGIDSQVIELRVEQPGLLNAAAPTAEPRDIGLAISSMSVR